MKVENNQDIVEIVEHEAQIYENKLKIDPTNQAKIHTK